MPGDEGKNLGEGIRLILEELREFERNIRDIRGAERTRRHALTRLLERFASTTPPLRRSRSVRPPPSILAARRPPVRYQPSQVVIVLCGAMQDVLRDCLRDAKSPAAKKKIRLRMKLERAWFLKREIPDRATQRRAGYTRTDLPPWAPLKRRLKCKPSPLLYPTLQ